MNAPANRLFIVKQIFVYGVCHDALRTQRQSHVPHKRFHPLTFFISKQSHALADCFCPCHTNGDGLAMTVTHIGGLPFDGVLPAAFAPAMTPAVVRAAALAGKVLTILAKAGDEGKLFGSVGTQDIANAAVQQGLQLARSEVLMPHGTIREIGEYTIALHLFAGISTEVLVRVVAGE